MINNSQILLPIHITQKIQSEIIGFPFHRTQVLSIVLWFKTTLNLIESVKLGIVEKYKTENGQTSIDDNNL